MRPELPNKEPWRGAFDTQATSSLLDKVHRAAGARMRTYGRSRASDGWGRLRAARRDLALGFERFVVPLAHAASAVL
jgi:hypothetical protein